LGLGDQSICNYVRGQITTRRIEFSYTKFLTPSTKFLTPSYLVLFLEVWQICLLFIKFLNLLYTKFS
jgi:hypothetical protein